MLVLCLNLIFLKYALSVPASSEHSHDEINSLKHAAKMLAVHLERWNNLFLTSLEPRIATSATLLSSINSNINNLQERAHVWDTFQLHVSAWNEQLATLDRKVDIISSGQEKIINFQNKLNSIANIEFKLDNLMNKIENLKIRDGDHYHHDVLFGEFAARGILSTVKMIEKKLDRLLVSKIEEKPKLKCNFPKPVEELLEDVSSKIDIIFDKIIKDYEIEGSGIEEPSEMKVVRRMNKPCQETSQALEDLLSRSLRIENASRVILDQENINSEDLSKVLQKCLNESAFSTILNKFDELNCKEIREDLDKSLQSHFKEQRTHFESFISKQMGIKYVATTTTEKYLTTEATRNFEINKENVMMEKTKKSCNDLDDSCSSGVYYFGNSSDPYLRRYCTVREDGIWTVIQRRDNYINLQNFSLDWESYKNGFGNLSRDFWFGNDYISRITGKDCILRIELWDFESNFVWAEYSTFKVLNEDNKFKLIIGGYSGNASDSFSSHNNTFFSTFDVKNDGAPDCCPCAVSYGGGWWFNSCFESNLNGVYYRNSEDNGYFRGIIWETWLRNYSLKRSLMMVKPKEKTVGPTLWSYYEDP